jgi:hypothetical protein
MLDNVEQSLENDVLSVERLEFGKFCVSPEGSVVRDNGTVIEYSLLGKSEGFPAELASYCKPKILDIEVENEDEDSNGFPYGTVLRPFVLNKAPQPVFFRVRHRFEKGEYAESGRRYKLGRYLTVKDDEIHPLMFLEAMEGERLQGITLEESRQIQPLPTKKYKPGKDDLTDKFVKEAVAFILSGIGVDVSEDIGEEDFFRCLSAVWSVLPPKLRPFLSAGWGVSRTLANDFAFSCSRGRNNTRAYFSASSREWSAPRQILSPAADGQTNLIEFAPRMIKPGEVYSKNGFAELYGESRNGKITFSGDPKEFLEWFKEIPEAAFAPLPTWQEPVLLKTFRSPGLKALDVDTLEKFKVWLSGDGQEEPFQDVKKFFFQRNRKEAFEEILELMAKEERKIRERTDSALWNSLSDNGHEIFSEILFGNLCDNKKRARLFAKLQARDASGALEWFYAAAAGRNEAENLPKEARQTLLGLLDESIAKADKTALTHHENLLRLMKKPQVYRAWLNKNERHLVKASANARGGLAPDLYSRIEEIFSDGFVKAIFNLQFGIKPTESDLSTVSAEPEEERKWLADFLRSLWEKTVSQQHEPLKRRGRFIPWLDFLKPSIGDDVALWNIYFSKPIREDQLPNLFQEVEENRVPAVMEEPLAAFVLRNWEEFSQRVRERARDWRKITDKFPPLFREVLLFESIAPIAARQRKGNDEISAAVNKFSVSAAEADFIIDGLNSKSSARLAELADFLWQILVEKGELSHDGSIANLCRHMNKGQLPEGSMPGLDRIAVLAHLTRSAKAYKKLKNWAREEWWSQIKQSAANVRDLRQADKLAKQMIMLLSVFPEIDFDPTPQQLELLVPYRQWLKKHLSKNDIHSKRVRKFEPAARDFQSLKFNAHKELWDERFENMVLSTAFSGVPPALQTYVTLQRALLYYSRINGEIPSSEISERAEMCLKYLESYEQQGPGAWGEAVAKVARGGLIPLLQKKYSDKSNIIKIIEIARNEWFGRSGLFGLGETMKTLGFGRSENLRINPASLEDLLKTVLYSYGSQKLKKDLDEHFKNLRVRR